MRLKRRLIVFAMLITMLLSTTAVVYAYSSATIYSTKSNLFLYDYIDFVEGPLIIQDTYYYRGVLSGSDKQFYPTKSSATGKIYITVYDDEGSSIKTVVLYNGYYSVTSSVKYGWGSNYGKLYMKCENVSKSIKQYAD